MHGGVYLDCVLIAGKHESLLRFTLEAARAVLHVPLVSGGLGIGRSGCRSEADLDNSHTARLDPGESIDGPRQLEVQSRRTVRQHLFPKALDHPALIWAHHVAAA